MGLLIYRHNESGSYHLADEQTGLTLIVLALPCKNLLGWDAETEYHIVHGVAQGLVDNVDVPDLLKNLGKH